MYSDIDIEMIEATDTANAMAAAGRVATHEPTDSDLERVYGVAYQTAYFMNPVWDCVADECYELGIDPANGRVQDRVFNAMQAASKDDAPAP